MPVTRLRYRQILSAVLATPWAILPEKLTEITAFLAGAAAGVESEQEFEARGNGGESHAVGRLAIIPVRGTLVHRGENTLNHSGRTSAEAVSIALNEAVADHRISTVVLDVDSPGGAVHGIPELAAEIRSLRERKRIVAVVNATGASAAYWLASQASELVVTPSGRVGSIGVILAHSDLSAQLEKLGVSITLITAGRRKAEGNPLGPLDDEARAELQSQVDAYYAQFVSDVALGRGVSEDIVRTQFGEGRMVRAQSAVDRGMADRVATFVATLGREASKQETTLSSSRAESARSEALGRLKAALEHATPRS